MQLKAGTEHKPLK